MEVSVGFGENRFTMSRGSFRYKRKLSSKRKLVFTGVKTEENGEVLSFYDKKTKRTFIFNLRREDGRDVLSLSNPEPSVNRYYITFNTNENEHIYGCGETYSKLDLKGEKVRIWVAEHQNAGRITGKIIREKLFGKKPNKVLKFSKYESYYAQPTFVSSDKYYVHCDIGSYAEFDFRQRDKITLIFDEAPVIITEQLGSFDKISERLSELLGRPRKLPDWIHEGAILAIQEGTDKVEDKIRRAAASGVNVCGVWSQDWSGCRRTGFGYQVMWNWEWDKELYPDLDVRIAQWKNRGIHFLGYINPFLAIEKELYAEATKKGYCVKDKDGKDYLVTITTFPAAMVDFTNPAAYEWYKNIIKKNMIGLGMSGWMADFGEYLPVDAVLFSGENAYEVHNRWPAIWAKLNREAIYECGKENEVFFFTRAGYTQTIKHTDMMWTGDQHVDWSVDDGLPSVIPATLSLAMSGISIAHSDVGGYTTIMHMRRSKELLLRWEEMNIFSPLFRTHEGNQPINDVQFDDDEELLVHLAWCTKVKEVLSSYIKSLFDEAVDRGVPVMRPLFYHYDEKECYTEKTEYLLGSDVLVCPVYVEGANEREVFLPKDEWVHLFTKEEYKGGKYQVEAPIGRPAVFVRKGSNWYDELIKLAK